MAIDADDIGEPSEPGVGGALLQHGDQHDDRGDEHAGAEEPDGGRCLARPATIDRTAEAEPAIMLRAEATVEALGPAVRLPGIAGRMQAAAADASLRAGRVGEIAIDSEQKIVESGIRQK